MCSEQDLPLHSYGMCLQDTSNFPVTSQGHRGLRASTLRSEWERGALGCTPQWTAPAGEEVAEGGG